MMRDSRKKTVQRILSIVSLVGLSAYGVLSMAAQAFAQGAAAVYFSQTQLTKPLGNDFSLGITVNPSGESIDTARIIVSYPKDLVEVIGFNLGGFLPNRSPGSSYSNSTGALNWGAFSVEGPTKTAGTFGTITFRPLKEGEGTVEILPSSHLISVGEEKINYAALGKAQISISGGRLEAPPAPPAAEPPLVPPAPPDVKKPEQVVEPEKVSPGVEIISSAHSDQAVWSTNNNARFSWMPLDGVSTYLVGISQDPEEPPKIRSRATTYEAKDLADGIWYFSVAVPPKVAGQPLTAITRYRIQIDTKAPKSFVPILEALRINGGNEVLIRATFGAIDDVSGISRYELRVNDGEFARAESPFSLKVAGQDKVRLTVRAYDNAENYRESSTELLIDLNQLPVISRIEAARLTNEGLTNWAALLELWEAYKLSLSIMGAGLLMFVIWLGAIVWIKVVNRRR